MSKHVFISLLSILLASSCGNNNNERLSKEYRKKKNTHLALSQVGSLPAYVKHPITNPSTPLKVELGRQLFYDPILSGDQDVACATCHHPDHGYAEFRDLSIGVNGHGLSSARSFKSPNVIPLMKRNSQTILNTAFNGINIAKQYDPDKAPMFWDMRVDNLEAQALEPILTLEEMRGTHFAKDEILAVVIQRLSSNVEYKAGFSSAFPGEPNITKDLIGKALACFERSLITNNSRFDKYLRGDQDAISISEKEGFDLFKKVGCANCHNGPMFLDYKNHVIGVPDHPLLEETDKGIDSLYSFRTPSLRNLRYTAPYMHNGTLPTLKRVLEFYEDISFGKGFNGHITRSDLDPLILDLDLRVKDMNSIISFLNTLNDDSFDRTIPEQVPSGLSVGGDIQ